MEPKLADMGMWELMAFQGGVGAENLEPFKLVIHESDTFANLAFIYTIPDIKTHYNFRGETVWSISTKQPKE